MNTLSIILIIVLLSIVLFCILVFINLFSKNNKKIDSLIITKKAELRDCYSIKDLRAMRVELQDKTTELFGDDFIKFTIPLKYRSEVQILFAIIDERLNSLTVNYLNRL